jgi:DNA-binding SARP family transcriptional activator
LVTEISLLGTFAVRVAGLEVDQLSVGTQRLLAFLAIRDRAVGRIAISGTMWPDAAHQQSGDSLRSALARLELPVRGAIVADGARLGLASDVAVDLRESKALAKRLLDNRSRPEITDLDADAVTALSDELLPDWYDDWVVSEAEDWRQLRMNALEAQAAFMIEAGRLAEAAGAARAAMKVEPLRESAHASLIQVHLAEGNQSEALRVFERYRTMLADALGLEPTSHVAELVASIRRHRAQRETALPTRPRGGTGNAQQREK